MDESDCRAMTINSCPGTIVPSKGFFSMVRSSFRT